MLKLFCEEFAAQSARDTERVGGETMFNLMKLVLICFISFLLLSCGCGSINYLDKNSKPRFSVNSDGIIYDTITNLEWVVGPDKQTTYTEAEKWVASLKLGGGGWRIPTAGELTNLYCVKELLDLHQTFDKEIFKTTGFYFWSSSEGKDYKDRRIAFQRSYLIGDNRYNEREIEINDTSLQTRVFAVRKPKNNKFIDSNSSTTNIKNQVAVKGIIKKSNTSVSVRSAPVRKGNTPIAIIKGGTEIEVLEERGEWLNIRFKDKDGNNKEGWISKYTVVGYNKKK